MAENAEGPRAPSDSRPEGSLMASTASDVCGHSSRHSTLGQTRSGFPLVVVSISDLRMPPRAAGAECSIFDRGAIKG
jgi:hypothetical protein